MKKAIGLLFVLSFFMLVGCSSDSGTPRITFTFNTDGGTEIGQYTHKIGDSFRMPDDPEKLGFFFDGWYWDNENFTDEFKFSHIAERNVISHVVLYAKWIVNQYTITYAFFSNEYNPLLNISLNPEETIIKLSLGSYHSSAITTAGRIFSWGYNYDGQLGDGTIINRTTPEQITDRFNLSVGETITDVSLGRSHSSAITSAGRVFTWGANGSGQLGDGTTTSSTTPVDITSRFNLMVGETFTGVSLGYYHSSAITSAGRIFTWGYNYDGQLGDGTIINRNTPVDITNGFNLSVGETITNVTLGSYYSSAITSEGRFFTWGANLFGQIGDGTTINRGIPVEIISRFNLSVGETITEISLGHAHSSAITSAGRIFTWGANWNGQLGDGTTTDRITPVEITNGFDLSVGETIIDLSLGASHSSAITSAGRSFAWGWNANGQLGEGTTIDRTTPVEITSLFNLSVGEKITEVSLGSSHSSAITSAGSVFIWGWNDFGQLGDGTTISRTTPFYTPEIDRVITYTYGEVVLDYIPVREGFIFDGWYVDITLTTANPLTTMPAENLILYARWISND